MAKRDPKQTSEEMAIFNAFLTAYPSFGATVIDHSPPTGEFPDRVVRLNDGSQIEFELAQRLNTSQSAMAKRRQQLSDAIEEAIGIFSTRKILQIFLVPKPFHSTSQLPCPLFAAIFMRPAHLSTRRNVPVSLIYPGPNYTA